jgi:hypothetical protein
MEVPAPRAGIAEPIIPVTRPANTPLHVVLGDMTEAPMRLPLPLPRATVANGDVTWRLSVDTKFMQDIVNARNAKLQDLPAPAVAPVPTGRHTRQAQDRCVMAANGVTCGLSCRNHPVADDGSVSAYLVCRCGARCSAAHINSPNGIMYPVQNITNFDRAVRQHAPLVVTSSGQPAAWACDNCV